MKKVLLFFSGGNDSTLCACKLASQGYDVQLITFDNGCEEGIENIRNRATILEKIFSNSNIGKVHNLGVFQSASEFMNMRYQSANIPFSEMIRKYGDLNLNQINCLNCRSGMYVVGTVVAKKLGIHYIAEGARKTQMFALEQKEILKKLGSLVKKYDIELLLPVFDYDSDYDVENELWIYSSHFYDKVYEGTIHYEAKCFLGIPMNRPLTLKEIGGYVKYFEDLLEPTIVEDIDKYPLFPIEEQLKNPTYSKIKFK